MVDFELNIKKEHLLERLKTANAEAIQNHGEGESFLLFSGNKILLAIQDDYLWADMGEDGWVSLDCSEFKPEMLIMMFEMHPELATEEVLLALFRAAGLK